MIANDSFVSIFGTVPAGDTEHLTRIVLGAVRAGFAVVIDKPGQKIPMCTLSEVGVRKADKEVRDAAREADDLQWAKRKHPCGLKHAITEEKKVGPLMKRLLTRYGTVNIGLELGLSRLVVVDVDTLAEKESFLNRWAAESGGVDQSHRVPTVSSPGVQETSTGEWKHKDGGHYWFNLPEGVELPLTGTGALRTGEGPGYSVMWANHQVLVPPSVRPEGAYQLQGQIEECPQWIIDMILLDVEARSARAKININRVFDGESSIDQWSAKTPWSEILGEDGWIDTGLPDNCSCPIWTAPGVHASPKSATAHDLGCSVYNTDVGHAPLHIWTDNPPDFLGLASNTLTKVQYLAHRDHGGSVGKALGELGIGEDQGKHLELEAASGPLELLPSQGPGPAVEYDAASPTASSAVQQKQSLDFFDSGTVVRTDDDSEDDEELEDDSVDQEPWEELLGQFLTSEQMESIEDPTPLVEGMLDTDTLVRVTGKPGHGKTFLMLDLACAIATGKDWNGHAVRQGPVVYMVAEGARGWKKRLRAWEQVHNNGTFIPGEQLKVIPFAVQMKQGTAWLALRKALRSLRPAMVVFDTQARVTVGMEENSATEMGLAVAALDAVRMDSPGCTVVAVHHLGHQGEQGRGSSAILGALHTEIRVTMDKDKMITVFNDKQKDDDSFEPIKARLLPVDEGVKHPSAVLEVVSADQIDPFDVLCHVDVDSPLWHRMAKYIYQVFQHSTRGGTKAEIKSVVNSVEKGERGAVPTRQAFEKAYSTLLAKNYLGQVEDEEGKKYGFKMVGDLIQELGLDTLNPLVNPVLSDPGRHLELVLDDEEQ